MKDDNINEDNVVVEPINTKTKANSSDDTETDLDDSVVAEENMSDIIKRLREKLKKCETEKQEYLTGWQRAKADNINARKREEESRKEYSKFANENLIHDLIPVLESYNSALANKDAWDKIDKTWRTGIEYIFNQLKKALESNGLTEMSPLGESFDASRDEATSHEKVSDPKLSGKIIAVISKGYSLNGKIVRPPKVVVGE
jgi:molecular chaperone GrpE